MTASAAAAVVGAEIPGTALYDAAVFFEAAVISSGILLDGKSRPDICSLTWSDKADAKPLLIIEVYIAMVIESPSNLNVPAKPVAMPLWNSESARMELRKNLHVSLIINA